MHSSSADCVFGDARFTSSTSTRFANTGPGLNSNSLLRWLQRFIALRKEHPVFGLGSYEPLPGDNARIFAHIRKWEEDIVLCVHNLARSAQAVQLDLSAYAGMVPVEMLGRTAFPPIGELPYLLTLAPRGFFWFQLRQAGQVE